MTATEIVLVVVAAALVLTLLAVWRASKRDRGVRRTRVGFFIERDRYHDDEPSRSSRPVE